MISQLNKYAQRHKTTLYTVMLSALDIMLYNFSSQKDIIVGTPFSNRNIQGVQQLIGFFVNALPIRSILDPDKEFDYLVEENNRTIQKIQNNQEVSLREIMKSIGYISDTSKSPIFQVLFSVQDFTEKIEESPLFEESDFSLMSNTTKYDLSIVVKANNIIVEYCTDLFDEDTVQAMLDNYIDILKEIINDEN